MATAQSTRPERALPGTHELVVNTALRFAGPGARVLELGAWSGALTERLQAAGFVVTAADIANHFELKSEFVQVDANEPNFEKAFSREFDVVTSVEVIEHLENPTGFLRSICKLLKAGGVAILTTPNVENVAARLKFLVKGELRAMDKHAPEHVTPIHLDLFARKIVPASGLTMVDHFVHPKNDFPLTARRFMLPFFRVIGLFLRGPALTGDCHFLILKKIPEKGTK